MNLLSWTAARDAAYRCAHPNGTEPVNLQDAIGRTLASDLRSLTDLPAHAASAMDGWAVAGIGPWQVLGDLRAGANLTASISEGEAMSIATGAAIPTGTTAIVRSEDGKVEGSTLFADAVAGAHIRPAGEEAVVDDLIITAGTLLTPLHIGLAAAAGHDLLEVVRRPRVRIAIFGDELLHDGRPRGGRIRDSLGPQLPAWMRIWGCEVVSVECVSDTLHAHIDALTPHDEIDLILTTGSTAHGPVDYLHDAISALKGRLIVDGVDCRPGHPMLLAQWPTHHLIGLPGNPQAAIAALHTLAAPLVRARLGMEQPSLPLVTFTGSAKRRDRETRLIPCTLSGTTATPVDHIGSGMLRGLTHADGFAVVSTEQSVSWIALQAL